MRETDLQEFLMSAAEAAFATGLDGAVRIWNRGAEELFGIRSQDAINRPCSELLEGRDSQNTCVCRPDCPVIQMADKGTQVPCFDLRVRARAGHPKWVNVSILRTRTSTGELLVVHLLRDIESRKELETITGKFLAQVGSLTGHDLAQLLTPASAPHVALTSREHEIVQLLARGLSTRAISQELNISETTVRNHVQHVMEKLSTHSRTEAVLRAVREGLA